MADRDAEEIAPTFQQVLSDLRPRMIAALETARPPFETWDSHPAAAICAGVVAEWIKQRLADERR